jgi:lipoprotein-anchoring transpeptidase ErfK/SrfK
LEDGVLIVVSIPSQKMFVFKDGKSWDSSPVSTGKRGNDTPPGVFPILQKKVMHRSNLYDDAPMPFMQRLTWDGVALHAGRVPGYPASHGCVRLPREFARKLYGITRFHNTIVIVADEEAGSMKEARKLA